VNDNFLATFLKEDSIVADPQTKPPGVIIRQLIVIVHHRFQQASDGRKLPGRDLIHQFVDMLTSVATRLDFHICIVTQPASAACYASADGAASDGSHRHRSIAPEQKPVAYGRGSSTEFNSASTILSPQRGVFPLGHVLDRFERNELIFICW
jgi:hypothetical protein